LHSISDQVSQEMKKRKVMTLNEGLLLRPLRGKGKRVRRLRRFREPSETLGWTASRGGLGRVSNRSSRKREAGDPN